MTKRSQNGFGLVEILIALTLGIVIILGITTLYTDSSRVLGDVSRATRLTETSSYAMELLTSDLELAGFWGERSTPLSETTIRLITTDVGNETWSERATTDSVVGVLDQDPPCACVGSDLAASCQFVTDDSGTTSSRAYDEDPDVELVRGMVFSVLGGSGAVLNAESAGSSRCGGATASVEDFVAIRRASTCADGEVGCRPAEDGVYHLQVQGDDTVEGAGGEILRRRGDLLLSNDTDLLEATLADGSPSPIYRYISRIYYLDSRDNLSRLSLGKDALGTLKYIDEELVAGVEALRFEWHIDTSGDGYGNELKTTPLMSEWIDVVAVTVWMVVRSPDAEQGYTDSLTYDLPGPTFKPPVGYESHRRMVLSKTVEMVNIAGRRRL
jgi:type IV pilus assembly protein PilW